MILVTGCTGFIGSHLCNALEREAFNYKMFKGDFTKLKDVQRELRDVETVIHLGALTYVPPSFDTPWTFFEVNTLGTLNFLKSRSMFDRFVYFSTSHTYGANLTEFAGEDRFLKETDCQIPKDPYSATKLAAENLVRIEGMKDDSFPYTVVRPFNNFGPRQARHFLVPTLIKRAMEKNVFIKGDSQRDFVYVKDTVEAVTTILDQPEKTHQETFNICTGKQIFVSEIASIINNIVNGDQKVRIDERDRPTDIALLGSNEKIRSILGWSPKYPLDEGLMETVNWYEAHSL
jgi:nucleoside-diphosphate-sugar epimerase